jgi:hypothetical protein
MFRSIFVLALFALAFGIAAAMPVLASQAQKPDSEQNKNFDVRSSLGDVHVGSDADARKAGLPLYPGARIHPPDEENSNAFNVGVLTEAFGIKLVIAKYDSDDAPDKVISYYRDRLKKYGKVLECHTHKHDGDHNGDTNAETKDDDNHSKALKCEGDGTGPVTELKVGFEDNQHVVTVESRDDKSGSTFALVYVHTRGKQGDI